MQDALQLVEKLRTDGQRFWQGLKPTQRAAVIAVGVAAVALGGLFLLWARSPSYAVAYANLGEEEAGGVVARLKEMKVPYQIREGGTVLVPTEQVHDVRLQLATDGIPKGGSVGFELFDQTNFGLTDFAQKINYQRALEGELSRTINRLEAVEQSRVHIVIPQPSLYTDNGKEATASVVLHLRPGRQLSRPQLRGITQLVMGSVEGLRPENVTIVDGKGNVLSEPVAPDGSDPSSSLARVEAQHAYETRVASGLQSLLNRILGPNRSTVQVNASFDWDKVESNSEVFSPNGQKAEIRSQRELTETYAGGALGAAGIPGVDSNVPTYQAVVPTPTVTSGGMQRKESTVNYDLSRRTEHVVRAPGSLKRLSVAVVVDSNFVAADQVETLREVVSAAAGLVAERGDVVTVTPLPFERIDDQPAVEAMKRQELILSAARIAAIVLSPLLVLAFLWLLVRRPGHHVRVKEVVPAQVALLPGVTAGLPSPGQPLAHALTEKDEQRERVRQQIVALAKENPAMTAQLIQTWLEEDR